MPAILVDSCILTDIARPDSQWHEWSAATLEHYDQNNSFFINSAVYAESSIAFESIEEFEHYLEFLRFECRAIPREALFLAGKAFLNYRRNKGSGNNVLPDFFIGAHAAVENLKLITRDKGRFSTYFPTVELIMPGG